MERFTYKKQNHRTFCDNFYKITENEEIGSYILEIIGYTYKINTRENKKKVKKWQD